MSTITSTPSRPVAEPAWDIARLFPAQGNWSEAEYLALDTNRLVELSDGCVEVLPLATEEHQEIVAVFYNRLYSFAEANRSGKVLFAPMPVKLWTEKMREPDVVFMKADNAERRTNKFWSGADLAMEVVSADERSRDLDVKRAEYARGNIPEY